jgi:hypothetical protein
MTLSEETRLPAMPVSSDLGRKRRAHWALITAVVIATLFNLALTVQRLHWRCPLTPWEAGIIVDGWRGLHNLPTYTVDHATNMYGPLLNVSSKYLFRLTGVNNFTLRVFELFSALAAAGLVAVALAPARWRLLSFCVLSLTNLRCGLHWVVPNPDSAALLFTALFLLLAYKNRLVLASLALVIAVLFKQPSAAAALIPIAAEIPHPSRKSFVPLLVTGVLIASIKIAFPEVFRSAFVVPTIAPYLTYRFIKAPIDILVGMPLFLVALAGWRPTWGTLERWLVSSIIVFFLAGTAMSARWGGGLNSYMLFIAAALALCSYRLPQMNRPILSALALLLTATAYISMPIGAAREQQGKSAAYKAVIAFVHQLPGKVACPEDPTIPLYAKGFAGVSVNMEMDATGQYAHLPPRVVAELESADWVLTLHSVFAGKWLSETELAALGFVAVTDERLKGSSYQLWRHVKASPR